MQWYVRSAGHNDPTRGLSCGRRTLAGSIAKPLAWAYSRNASLNRGSVLSA